jgi:hypothetical protein
MKRINSHLCSVAYPILEDAGVLSRSRLKSETAAAEISIRAEQRNEASPAGSNFRPTT